MEDDDLFYLFESFLKDDHNGDFIWWYLEDGEEKGLENVFITDTERTNYTIGQIVEVEPDHEPGVKLTVRINAIRLEDPKASFFDENRTLIISFSYV